MISKESDEMKIGQITNIHKQLDMSADYLQLDICGLDKNSALEKLIEYKKKNPYLKEIILHGDWEKKGFSENNIDNRFAEYIDIINELSKHINIKGITIHPVNRNKYTYEEFIEYCNKISMYTSVFIENRSAKNKYLSSPEEIIAASNKFKITLDIPQLYISCGYDKNKFEEVLNKINHKNVYEYHLGNIKKTNKNTFVARRLNDPEGILDYQCIKKYLNKDSLFTLEILGGNKIFKEQQEYFRWEI